MRNVICFCFWIVILMSCGGDSTIEEIGEAGHTIHLIPFQCTYFGIPISELEGCSIACPGKVFYEHDLETFSSSLSCTHPSYSFLTCGLNR